MSNYSGGPDEFPPASAWISFEDMWALNLPNIQQSCTWLDSGSDNTDEQNQEIYAGDPK